MMQNSLNGEGALLARVADVFREVFDEPKLEVNPATSPAEIAEWDSVAQVKLVMAFEEAFGVQFDPDEVLSFTTAGAFVDSLKSHGVSG
jgi:acyl carrier protein